MLQVTEYPVTDGKVKKQGSKYELPKNQSSRWKCGDDVEFYYQNLNKNSSDSQKDITTSSAALNNSADLVDREVQTDIDGVHYKVTSKFIQGGKVRVPSAKEKTEEMQSVRRRSSAYGRSTLAVHSRRAHLFHKSGQEGPSFLVSVPSLDGIVLEYEKMIDVDHPTIPPPANTQEASPDLNEAAKTHRRKNIENRAGMKQLNVENVRVGDSDSDHVTPRSDRVVFNAAPENDDSQHQSFRLHPFDGLKRREVRSATVRSADSTRRNDVTDSEKMRRPKTANVSSNANRMSPNQTDFYVPKNAWVNRVPSAVSRATTPTIPHKQRHITTSREFDRPQFIVASKIRPQVENVTKDGKYRRHIAGGSNYMQLIKHIRRPRTAPSSMPSSKYIQDSDSSSSISDVEEDGKTKTRKDTASPDKQRSNGHKTNRNPKGLDCVEPPKTRLHISTKQEILKVYRRNTAEDREVMLRLDKEGYKASMEWKHKQERELLGGEEADQAAHLLSDDDAHVNLVGRMGSDMEGQRKSAPEIFLPGSNGSDGKGKLDLGAERDEFDPKKLFRYSPRMVVDYTYPPCHHANGPYGLKYWIDEITRRLNKKQKEAQKKNKKSKPKVSKPKMPIKRISHSQITTDQINRVETNLNQLLKETTEIEMNEKRLDKSGMDQQTKDELLFLNMMDNLSMR